MIDVMFYSSIKEKISKSPLAEALDLAEEAEVSQKIAGISVHDATGFRLLHRARKIAHYVITDEGRIDQKRLNACLEWMEKEGAVPYPDSLGEAIYFEQMATALRKVKEEKALQEALLAFKTPVCHHWMESLIALTLQSDEKKLTDAALRRAAFTALLTPLRQSVGSCFATAPAILIQKERPGLLLADLQELMEKGKFERTIQGDLFSVPLSPYLNLGELKMPFSSDEPIEGSPFMQKTLQRLGLEGKAAFLLQIKPKSGILTQDKLLLLALAKKMHVPPEQIEQMRSSVRLSRKEMEGISPKAQEAFLLYERGLNTLLSFVQNPLLKIWEYTLASLADYKVEFFKWNLAASLGLKHEEKAGLGELLYSAINGHLQDANKQVERYQVEAEEAFNRVRVAETLLAQADSHDKARRLNAELTAHLHHLNSSESIRNRAYVSTEEFSKLYAFLISAIQEKFKEYFQEIYDPLMHGLEESLFFEDAPAGFRLVYKQGRQDPSSWTLIHDESQYVEVLVNFFTLIESDIMHKCPFVAVKIALPDLFTKIIHHLRSPEFIASAYARMAKMHGASAPSEKLEKKPWSYTSGGAMNTLLKCYFHLEAEPTEERRWAESEMDLLTFLLDTLKGLPLVLEESFKQDRHRGLLMYSPTHAFILKPGLDLFMKGWTQNGFSYTWARDHIFLPQKKYYSQIFLESHVQKYLAYHFLDQVRLKMDFSPEREKLYPWEFRKLFMEQLFSKEKSNRLKGQIEDRFDGFLKSSLPCLFAEDSLAAAQKLFQRLLGKQAEVAGEAYEKLLKEQGNLLLFKEWLHMAKTAVWKASGQLGFQPGFDEELLKLLAEEEMAPPPSLLFADTNWMKYYFAFAFNPGNERLQLWRMDHLGVDGIPMSIWDPYLNGQNKSTWGVYTRPQEFKEKRSWKSFFFKKV